MNNTQLTAYTRKKQQPTEAERAQLKQRLYAFSNLNRVAKVFKRTPQQIGQAFRGLQPTLMNKIKKHIEILERKSESIQEQN